MLLPHFLSLCCLSSPVMSDLHEGRKENTLITSGTTHNSLDSLWKKHIHTNIKNTKSHTAQRSPSPQKGSTVPCCLSSQGISQGLEKESLEPGWLEEVREKGTEGNEHKKKKRSWKGGKWKVGIGAAKGEINCPDRGRSKWEYIKREVKEDWQVSGWKWRENGGSGRNTVWNWLHLETRWWGGQKMKGLCKEDKAEGRWETVETFGGYLCSPQSEKYIFC